jgi:predicted dithiol-disulfide oxidoreductase (DUF899 family)
MADKNPTEIQNEITALEQEIFRKKEELTKLRHQIPPEPVNDYTFHGSNDTPIKLSELFGNRDELLLIHNMGKGCPYCTLWADGFNGVLNHIENRTAFAVVSPDDTATQSQFASSRGWKFRLVSGKGNSFTKDMGFLSAKGASNREYRHFIKTKPARSPGSPKPISAPAMITALSGIYLTCSLTA